METKLVYLSDLKFNLKVWKEELRFHRKEMEKFEKKLEDIAKRNLGIEAMAPLEGFQNKIIREKGSYWQNVTAYKDEKENH